MEVNNMSILAWITIIFSVSMLGRSIIDERRNVATIVFAFIFFGPSIVLSLLNIFGGL